MKKMYYYLILIAIFAILLIIGSIIVSLLFSAPGGIVMYLMCFIVIGVFRLILPMIKKEMKM